MASPRLLFLYPSLFRSWRSLNGTHSQATIEHLPTQPQRYRRFHTTTRRQLEPFIERHGTAVEPPPGLGSSQPPVPDGLPKISKDGTKGMSTVKGSGNETKNEPSSAQSKADSVTKTSQPNGGVTSMKSAVESDTERSLKELSSSSSDAKRPETVLHMDPPAGGREGSHLHAPLYVHHFDMYALVRNLEEKGFTGEQSVTLMKAVRGLLAANLELAKEELVSKSDSENVRLRYYSRTARADSLICRGCISFGQRAANFRPRFRGIERLRWRKCVANE